MGMVTMPDDPREILRAAGVECAEVTDYFKYLDLGDAYSDEIVFASRAVILALANLVAKYKWVAERHESVVDRVIMDRRPQFDALEARWEAEHA